MRNDRFLMIAGSAYSLKGFRGPLLLALRDLGLEVHVAAPGLKSDSPLVEWLELNKIHVHDVPLQRARANPLSDIWSLWCLFRIILRIKPKFVLPYTIKPVIYGTIAAWMAKVPRRFALITGLGYVFEAGMESDKLRIIVEKLYKFALSKAHLIFFQNPDDRKLFQSIGVIKRSVKDCVVNGSGVPLEHFRVTPISNDSVSFLLIARLINQKGIREYIDAARIIKKRHPDVNFRLVGKLDENPNSIRKEELDNWILEGIIEYLGYLEDIRPAMENASVFVLPSYYPEGTPRSILEAMSMGRAIITTDTPGCRETVVEGLNGFLVASKSHFALVEAMEKFISEPNLIFEMGQRSRRIAEDKFDVNKVNSKMIAEMGII